MQHIKDMARRTIESGLATPAQLIETDRGALSVLLMAIYLIWLVVAYALSIVIFGYSAPTSIEQFITDLLTTPRGWTLIIARWGIGFLFAALVCCPSARSHSRCCSTAMSARRSRCTPRFA